MSMFQGSIFFRGGIPPQSLAKHLGSWFLHFGILGFPPGDFQDMMAAEYLIHRVSHVANVAKPSVAAGAHACDDGQHASKNRWDPNHSQAVKW